MDVVEDFELWPHKVATLLVARDKGIQEVRALKMAGTLSGHSGGSMPGRSNAEGGKEENDEDDEVPRLEKEVMHAVLTANLIESITSGVLAWGVLGTRGVVSSSSDGVDEELFSTRESKLGVLAGGERAEGEGCAGLAH